MATNVQEPYIICAITTPGTLDANPRRSSSTLESFGRTSSSGLSAGSEDTTDSGFYQLNPDNLTPELRSPSPRPSPRAIRRLSNMTESTDAEDIDFFLKVVTEFRAYVTEKIEELEQQHQINANQLEKFQNLLKESEEAWTANEINIKKEISVLIALLQRRQGIYVEQIKKQRSKETDLLREKMDICRRNMKIISGVLGFAKRIANEKDDSIRQQTLKDLKQRFTTASEREPPDISSHDHGTRVVCKQTLDDVKAMLEDSLSGSDNQKSRVVLPTATPQTNKPPTISAQSSPHDVTKSSIIVRWIDDDISDDVSYEVRWKSPNDLEPKWAKEVTDCQYVINGLNSNTDITVQVRRCKPDMTSELSTPGFFRTEPQPAKFHLDSDTANAKLQLSPDLYSVHYPGDSKNSGAPKSPSRFTFALNVLGNISFFTGRHYWEVLVNTDGWAIGVAYRNVPRNSWLGSNDYSWILHYDASKKKYIARHAGEAADVEISRKKQADEIRRIGVFLDYEEGIISFVNCRHMEVLHTYRANGFTEPVTAAVNPFYHGGALTVITGLDIPDINFGT